MSGHSGRNRLVMTLAAGALVAVVFVVFIPRFNPPKPQRHSFHIFAGHVSRNWIRDSAHETDLSGSFSLPILPHHLQFDSSNGEVQIYVVKLTGNAKDQITQMMQLTEELQSGRPPDSFVAFAAGASGRIELHHWPYGMVKYLFLVLSEQDSNVNVIVHYGP